MIDLVLLVGAASGTTYLFHQVNPVAGYLLLPYLAWLGLASALNYTVWRDNKPAATITEVKDK